LRLASGFIAAVVCLLAVGAASGEDDVSKPKLSKHDYALLANLRAEGAKTATLLVATVEGQTDAVAQRMQAAGGTIRYRDDDVGYLRVIVPLGEAAAFARIEGVQATDVDELVPLPKPGPREATATRSRGVDVAPPDKNTPPLNPYMPTQDTGAPQFVQEHPTYDGRGITIGIVDTGVDILTPELQTAKRADGSSVKKFADWITGTDPVTDNDPSWVSTTEVTVENGKFKFNDVEYTAPTDSGVYRIGFLTERDFGMERGYDVAGNLNRDRDDDDVFPVLWGGGNMARVWVDTDVDASFADQKGMQIYRKNHDTDQFGTDDKSTPVRESVPFVIGGIDKASKKVNIGMAVLLHGTHVAGIAAGKHFMGGNWNGAAPEARIVAVTACTGGGCTTHGMVEGMIYATQHADVVNMSIGGLPALNDGNNARALLYNRLITRKDVQMFIAAGNDGPGVNTVSDPSVASKVESVAASITKATWLSNYGADAVKPEQIFGFSSRGPREDGGFKPNIAAPGAAISSIPGFLLGLPVSESGYQLPPGYAMENGTSMATPQSTGAAALILSAAAQNGMKLQAKQLRQALHSSARMIDNFRPDEQGNGEIQVGAAWNLLQQGIDTVAIDSDAPVNTILSGQLKKPNRGEGIYEREGWRPGDTGERTITLKREGPGSSTFDLSWVGNDGTFATSVKSVTLTDSTPVEVPVSVSTATAGTHSAILDVDDPNTVGIDYQVLNTVIAAEEFTSGNNFTVKKQGQTDRPDKVSYFAFVPPDTPNLTVNLKVLTGRLHVYAFHPAGTRGGLTTYCTAPCEAGLSFNNPSSGVWELDVEASRISDVPQPQFELTAVIQGVRITPPVWTIDPAQIGHEYDQTFGFRNDFGAYTGAEYGTDLASTKTSRPTIKDQEIQEFTVEIPAGATAIRAKIGNTSDPGCDLDLYVFDPTGNEAGRSADGDAEEEVTIDNPVAGTWKVQIVGYAIPQGETEYDYLDAISHPMFGSITVPEVVQEHPNGDTWERSAKVTANAAPDAGRFLQGFVEARSADSVLGRAEVQLMNLSSRGVASAPSAGSGSSSTTRP